MTAKRLSPRKERRRTRAHPAVKALKWLVIVAVVAGAGYGISRLAGVPYDETDIRVVDFSPLTAGEKRSALQAANRARCPCGCGMNVAQCVSTDATCPLRERNIQLIRTMVREADTSPNP
jgi:hypothetical protein